MSAFFQVSAKAYRPNITTNVLRLVVNRDQTARHFIFGFVYLKLHQIFIVAVIIVIKLWLSSQHFR